MSEAVPTLTRMRERRQLDGNGITISCLMDGPVDAPPMVLVHGGSLNAQNWAPVMDVLADDYRVYAPDPRGHGQSSWPAEYSFGLLAADVDAFVRALGLSSVVLVGHSIGGATVLLAAQQRPDWLAALMLEEPTVIRPGLPTIYPPKCPDGTTGVDWDAVVHGLYADFNDPNPAYWDRLADIDVPTLVFVGADENLNPKQERMHEAAALIPDVRVRTIAVGHRVHEVAPDRFLDALSAFLGPSGPTPRLVG